MTPVLAAWSRSATALWLALAGATASATCTLVNGPMLLSGKLTLVGSAATSLGRHLHGTPMTAQFAFKCDADTAYSLLLTDAAGAPATLAILRDERGNQVPTAIKLRSVDSRSVNLDFSKLPLSGYADRALGGKLIQVLLEMTPGDTAIASNAGIAKNFTGNFKISLQY